MVGLPFGQRRLDVQNGLACQIDAAYQQMGGTYATSLNAVHVTYRYMNYTM